MPRRVHGCIVAANSVCLAARWLLSLTKLALEQRAVNRSADYFSLTSADLTSVRRHRPSSKRRRGISLRNAGQARTPRSTRRKELNEKLGRNATNAHAGPGADSGSAAFGAGLYDGARRNHFFQRVTGQLHRKTPEPAERSALLWLTLQKFRVSFPSARLPLALAKRPDLS